MPARKSPDPLAAKAIREIRALPVRNTPSMRSVRKRLTRSLKESTPAKVRSVADALIDAGYKWLGYEVIQQHPGAFASLSLADVESLGRGMESWGAVDAFCVTIAGPAWREGLISDAAIRRWAGSDDVWWRRAALVATTALNVASRGGQGDTRRTLAVCKLLAADREDMVEKALSWALRELIRWDPEAVAGFIDAHDAVICARVKREVNNKLATGYKNP